MSTVESRSRRATSAGPAPVVMTLVSHPPGRVVVPLVGGVGQRPEGRLDVVPAPLVIDAATDELGDEGTPTPRTDASVELGHQIVRQRNVYTHVPRLAHRWRHTIRGS